LLCVGVPSTSCRRPQVATTLNSASIRAIKIGMTEQQVRATLGEPLQIRPWGPRGVIYDYAIPGPFAPWSSALWIQFKDGAVTTVHARRSPLMADDYAVYELRSDRDYAFEHTDFERTFRR